MSPLHSRQEDKRGRKGGIGIWSGERGDKEREKRKRTVFSTQDQPPVLSVQYQLVATRRVHNTKAEKELKRHSATAPLSLSQSAFIPLYPSIPMSVFEFQSL